MNFRIIFLLASVLFLSKSCPFLNFRLSASGTAPDDADEEGGSCGSGGGSLGLQGLVVETGVVGLTMATTSISWDIT